MFSPLQFGVGVTSAAFAGIAGTIMFYELRSGDVEQGDSGVPIVTLVSDSSSGESGRRSRVLNLAIDDPRISFRQLDRIGESMALRDPEGAIEVGMKIPGTDNRESFLKSVFQTWGETDGVAAANWASENLEGGFLSDALFYIADGWAESDPAGAAEWFTAHAEGVILDDAAWEILESWGRKDPSAAFQWAGELDLYVREYAMDGLGAGWAAVDPQAAMKAGMEMLKRNEGHAYEFLVSVASQWAGSDPISAVEWGESLLNEQVRAGILEEVAEVWAMTDPDAAADWVERIEDPGSRRFGMRGTVIGWSEHDPDGAMEWLLGFSGDEHQVRPMVADIMHNWVNADPRGAVLWLREKSPGPERDVVLDVFSDAMILENPEAAVAWAAEIGDSSLRDARVGSLIETWIQMDGETAVDRIDDMNLPSHLKPESVPSSD
jgi:hypothetical protein